MEIRVCDVCDKRIGSVDTRWAFKGGGLWYGFGRINMEKRDICVDCFHALKKIFKNKEVGDVRKKEAAKGN